MLQIPIGLLTAVPPQETDNAMPRRSIDGARTIVTGASSGIGRALARELARQGAELILTARRAERLAELAAELQALGRTAHVVAGDITDPAVRQQVVDAAATHWGGLDLLINNAGVGAVGPFAAAAEARLRRVMEVNFFAPAELIRQSLPLLQAGRRPMVVNIGSVLGHRAVPDRSEYCASKFALHGLSDALRCELAPRGIDVLLVSPSLTQTEFAEAYLEKPAAEGPRPWGAASAESVARATVRAIRHGRHEILLTTVGKLFVWADRLCPPLANRLIARFSRGTA